MNFGVVYAILLLLFLIFGYIFKSNDIKKILIIGDIFIALPAYFAKPSLGVYADTVRFNYILDQMRGINSVSSNISDSLHWVLNSSEYSTEPFISLYMWPFSFFNNNGVFFFVTTFLFLLFLSLLLVRVKKYFELKNLTVIIVQFLVLVTFNLFFQIEGIRNFLSFMIFAWALFEDLTAKSTRNKIISVIAYVLCMFLHPFTIVFVIFRIVLFVKNNVVFLNNAVFDTLISLALLFYNCFIDLFINVLSLFTNITFVNFISIKLQSYIHGQANFDTFSSKSEILFTTLILLALLMELLLFLMCYGKSMLPKSYLSIYVYIISFTIGSFLSTQLYLRTIMLVLFMSTPIKSLLFSNIKTKGISQYIIILYEYAVCLIAIMLFVYWYMVMYKNILIF